MTTSSSRAEDNHKELDGVVGTAANAPARQRCLDLARGMSPRGWQPEDAVAHVLLTARRFARFIIDGTTPGLCWVDDSEPTASGVASATSIDPDAARTEELA